MTRDTPDDAGGDGSDAYGGDGSDAYGEGGSDAGGRGGSHSGGGVASDGGGGSGPAAVADSQQGLVVGLVGVSHFVNHAYFTLLPPIYAPLREEGLTDPELGLALGVLGFVVTALQLPFGHLSDTRGRTAVWAISLSFGALGAALTALAVDFRTLVLAQVVLGVGIAGHHPAHYPLIAKVTTAGTRGRAYSVHGFTGAIGFAAPFAVVATTQLLGFGWRTAVGAVAVAGAVVGAAVLLAVRRRVDPAVTAPGVERTEADGRRLHQRILETLRDASSPAILALTALWFVTSVAGWGIKQYTATLLEVGYAVGPGTANLAVAATLVAGAFAMFGGGWLTDRWSPGPVLAGGYVALVAVTLVLATRALPVVLALGVVLGLSATVDGSRPARAALADRLSTEATVGKNFGLLTIGISGGAAVAPPILGVVVGRLGIAAAFYAIAGVGVVCLALTWLVVAVAGRPGA